MTLMADPIRFSESFTLRCDPALSDVIRRASRARGSKPVEWLRQAAQTAAKLDGIEAAETAAPDAGALYDVVEGQQRFALIEGGSVKAMSYHAERPSNGDWRPVQHEDSDPFDPLTKWREWPVVRIEADRVVVTYPVVDRSAEWSA